MSTSWNEAEHPRDKEGKFTYKGGGSNGSNNQGDKYNKMQEGVFKLGVKMEAEAEKLANVLYKDAKIKNEIEKAQNIYKNKLLDILGKHATAADVLYSNIKKLENKIREYGLGKLLDKIKPDYPQTLDSDFKTDFQKDTDKHEVLRKLSVYCYDNGKQQIPEGYERVGHFESKNNGFDAVVVKNSSKKEIVIAYRGMEPGTLDMPDVVRARIRNYSSQMRNAQAVYDIIKSNPDFKDYEIYTTGQSLGGYLAQYVAGKNNLKSATFNAFHGTEKALSEEAKKYEQNMPVYSENIVNYRNSADALSHGSKKNNIGLSLDTKTIVRTHKKPINHMAENMGDLTKTKTTNKNYIKNIDYSKKINQLR